MPVIQDIAFVRYEAPELELMEAFLCDFGLQRVARSERALYMRTSGAIHHAHVTEWGPASCAVGFGLFARNAEDLSQVAEFGGVPVEPVSEPGGGWRVRLRDPAGFTVDVIHGQASLTPLPQREPLEMNPATNRRRFGRAIRLRPQPSGVMRLGHVALLVPDLRACLAFYRDVLGFRISDTYWAGAPDNLVAAFLHCGLGLAWTDHHTIALISARDGVARFDHCAFEVLDLDDVVQGGEYLRARGHRHSWGVGRHIQGSQLFDYWRDPYGHKIEHWTDGDLVNDTTPAGHAELREQELRQWAPPLSPEFFQ